MKLFVISPIGFEEYVQYISCIYCVTYVLIISLRMFVQIRIFVHIFEEIEPKQRFALYMECYKKYTFNTSCKEFTFDVAFIEYYRLYL